MVSNIKLVGSISYPPRRTWKKTFTYGYQLIGGKRVQEYGNHFLRHNMDHLVGKKPKKT